MKELSIEEKAKAYDEALKYAMIYYKDGNEDMKTMMRTCFPVLVEESKDERACGKLIAFLKQCKAVYGDGFKQFGLDIDDAIAWLEKKCEQKVEPKSYASETMNEKGDFDDGFTRMMEKEQKSAEWSEEDEVMLRFAIEHFEIQKRNSFEGGLRKKSMQEFVDWLKSLKERCTWKPSKKQIMDF